MYMYAYTIYICTLRIYYVYIGVYIYIYAFERLLFFRFIVLRVRADMAIGGLLALLGERDRARS